MFITPGDSNAGGLEDALASVLAELKGRLAEKDIAEFAICSDVDVKFAHLPERQRVLKIEFQNGTAESAVFYFPLTVADGRATVGSYMQSDLPERLL